MMTPDTDQQGTTSLPTWTVMVYLAGDNNLTEECIYSLSEMKKADVHNRIRIFAQFDPLDEFLPSQRYRINYPYPVGTPGNPNGALAEDLSDYISFRYESKKKKKVKYYWGELKERRGEGGTGDPRMLFNFIAYCVDQRVKTDHYMLIVSGHGAGVMRHYLLRDQGPDGSLTIKEMTRVLKWAKQELKDKYYKPLVIDILGLDVCLMSMAEISYELKDLVKIAVGCESYSPQAGWPYGEVLQSLHDFRIKPELRTLEQLGKRMVGDYIKYYSDYWLGGLSVDQSALDIKRVNGLKSRVRTLSRYMRRELRNEFAEMLREERQAFRGRQVSPIKNDQRASFTNALILTHWRSQSYNGELYVDLADFCDCLVDHVRNNPQWRNIVLACEELSRFIKESFVLRSCFSGRKYQYSYGVSIYFPWDFVAPYYGSSPGFAIDSGWLEFLKLYVRATRRKPRPGSPDYVPRKESDRLFEVNFGDVRMSSDKMSSDKMSSDKGGNPMSSMRNPPIVFVPDECMLNPEANARAQRRLMRYAISEKRKARPKAGSKAPRKGVKKGS